MAFKLKDLDDSQAPLLEHLIELRKRLVRAVLALGIAFAVCFYFADDIFGLLVRPLTEAFPPGEGRLVFTKLYEQFFVDMKVALFAGFLLYFLTGVVYALGQSGGLPVVLACAVSPSSSLMRPAQYEASCQRRPVGKSVRYCS